MVMATVSVCQQFSGELSHEAGDATDDASAEATALHERLVAYVHALAGGHEPRSGVWVEHSYARARGATHAPAAHVRVLLAPRLPDERGDVDVERVEPPPPELPELPAEPETERDDSDTERDDDWEACVTALAPSAAHTRLAENALDALRRMRLERLAGGRADTAARTAARRLRLALAAAAAHTQRPGPWLHTTLQAYMPRAERRLGARGGCWSCAGRMTRCDCRARSDADVACRRPRWTPRWRRSARAGSSRRRRTRAGSPPPASGRAAGGSARRTTRRTTRTCRPPPATPSPRRLSPSDLIGRWNRSGRRRHGAGPRRLSKRRTRCR